MDTDTHHSALSEHPTANKKWISETAACAYEHDYDRVGSLEESNVAVVESCSFELRT